MTYEYPDLIYDILDVVDGKKEAWTVEAELDRLGFADVATPFFRRLAWGHDQDVVVTSTLMSVFVRQVGFVYGRRGMESSPVAEAAGSKVAARRIRQVLTKGSPMDDARSAIENIEVAEQTGLFDPQDPSPASMDALHAMLDHAGRGLVEGAFDRGFIQGVTRTFLDTEDPTVISGLRGALLAQLAKVDDEAVALEGWVAAVRADLQAVGAEADEENLLGMAAALVAGESLADERARASLRGRFMEMARPGMDAMDTLLEVRQSYSADLLGLERRVDDRSLPEELRGEAELALEAVGRAQGVLVTDDQLADFSRVARGASGRSR